MRRRRLIVACALLGGALWVVSPAAGASTSRAERVKVADYFTKDDIARARRYRAPAYAFSFLALAAQIAAVLVLGLAWGTRRLASLADRTAGQRWWLQAIVLALAVSFILALVDLPFGAAREALDRAWGLSTRNAGGFLGDFVKGFAFQAVLAVIVALAFFWITRTLPRGWPVAAAGAAVVLTFVLSMLWPLVYEPLFNKFTPVEPELRARIVAIGEKSGVRIGSVVIADASRRTTRQNAYVSGLGSTKRVVLYDTLLDKSTPKEVDLVVAHEFGHVKHNDVVKGTAFGALGAVAGVVVMWLLLSSATVKSYLGISGASDVRALPFLVMFITVAGLLTLPVGNWYSRRIEADADRHAVHVTRDIQTAVQVEVSLARDN
ncbi:MAG: M48 family metallopeptidase, partial [Actinobacteria bacterium]|nr:M48 family metallopeptidase [Actinomycetota bacterium]